MGRKHYNPRTGKMETCRATAGKCPFGAHFENEAEGQAYADEQNRKMIDRENFIKNQKVEYQPTIQNIINNINYDYQKNWEKTEYKDLNDFISKEKERTDEYEKRIREVQTGESGSAEVDDFSKYKRTVRTDLSEEKIQELLRDREKDVVDDMMEKRVGFMRNPYDFESYYSNTPLNKDDLEKHFDEVKRINTIRNNNLYQKMMMDVDKIKKNTTFKCVPFKYAKDINHDGKEATTYATMAIYDLDNSLERLGFPATRDNYNYDKNGNIDYRSLYENGYENENYKATFLKTGGLKVQFKNAETVDALEKARDSVIREKYEKIVPLKTNPNQKINNINEANKALKKMDNDFKESNEIYKSSKTHYGVNANYFEEIENQKKLSENIKNSISDESVKRDMDNRINKYDKHLMEEYEDTYNRVSTNLDGIKPYEGERLDLLNKPALKGTLDSLKTGLISAEEINKNCRRVRDNTSIESVKDSYNELTIKSIKTQNMIKNRIKEINDILEK